MQNQSNSYAEDEDMAGEEIVQRLDSFEPFTTAEDNIRNKKAVLDSSKKYTINKSFDFCLIIIFIMAPAVTSTRIATKKLKYANVKF